MSSSEDISIPRDIARLNEIGVLGTLLKDNSTDGNIVWGTSAYEGLGAEYRATDEMTVDAITGDRIEMIRRRARKDKDERTNLTRSHAEVFTPTWICKLMIDHADEAWLQNQTREASWKEIIQSPRLEITCGEAPYLFGRYDAANGNPIAFEDRIGIYDRKLYLIAANTSRRQDFMRWAIKALQSTYGYEFQGDNLLIARINAFATIEEALDCAGYKPLEQSEAEGIAETISWNLWQMDGLTKCVPFGSHKEENPQMDLFGGLFDDPPSEQETLFPDRGLAKIKNWSTGETVEFDGVSREGKAMKFDYIIGNPPYQEEVAGENKNSAAPIYHHFMEGAYEISDVVELIHPARFLFNAGSTPKSWNEKMLNDEHLSILYFEPDSSKVFPGTDIKGGVAITIRSKDKDYGRIGTFTAYPELNSLLSMIDANHASRSFSDIVITRTAYRLTDMLHEDNPDAIKQLSTGHPYDMSTNIFDRLPSVFFDRDPKDGHEYIRILGREDNERTEKYIRSEYVNDPGNLRKWKVFVPAANGSGTFGETLSAPIIGEPLVGHTESFISIGNFDTRSESEAAMKYIKSKFARSLLGVLKATQHNPPEKWKYIPMQDFSNNSDIDWSLTVPEIDKQLYKKYGLSSDEIDFIESHVKEMV